MSSKARKYLARKDKLTTKQIKIIGKETSYPHIEDARETDCGSYTCSPDNDNCSAEKVKCGPCNQVTKSCSPSLKASARWHASKYSKKCAKADNPIIVRQEDREAMVTAGFEVVEFPRGSGDYLTCPKKGQASQLFYLIANELDNSREYPYLPCCESLTRDPRRDPQSKYNVYYKNLEQLHLHAQLYEDVIFNLPEDATRESIITNIIRFLRIANGTNGKNQLSIIGMMATTSKSIQFAPLDAKEKAIKPRFKRGAEFLSALQIPINLEIADGERPFQNALETPPERPIGAMMIGCELTPDDDVPVGIIARLFLEEDKLDEEIGVHEDGSILQAVFDTFGPKQDEIFRSHSSLEIKSSSTFSRPVHARIRMRGRLPPNVKRFLGLLSLSCKRPTESWERLGVCRPGKDFSVSFLHCLETAITPGGMFPKQMFPGLMRKLFYERVQAMDWGKKPSEKLASAIGLCQQSMYDYGVKDIASFLRPSKDATWNTMNTYLDPRLFHALAQYVYQLNIVLITKKPGQLAELTLPRHQLQYIPNAIWDRTVIIYEHYGSNTLSARSFPVCELIISIPKVQSQRSSRLFLSKQASSQDEIPSIGGKLVASWLATEAAYINGVKFSSSDVPNGMSTINGWKQIVGPYGKTVALKQDGKKPCFRNSIQRKSLY